MFRSCVQNASHRRDGAVVVLIGLLLIPMLAMVAFAVDVGFILETRCRLQSGADAAALAAVARLAPDADGNQSKTDSKLEAIQYATNNLGAVSGSTFQIADVDFEVGRFDTGTIYDGTSVTLLETGMMDAVRLKLRRDNTANGPIPLFFARVLGRDTTNVNVTSTALLRKANGLNPGAMVVPIALHQDDYEDAKINGQTAVLYDNVGVGSAGNFGLVDVGLLNNSAADVIYQIKHGLRDLDFYGRSGLHEQGLLDSDGALSTTKRYNLNTGPGLKVTIERALREIEGETRIVPIYDLTDYTDGKQGENLNYHIVSWAVVKIADVDMRVQPLKISVEPGFRYDGKLRPNTDLTDTINVIEGAFTSPALAE